MSEASERVFQELLDRISHQPRKLRLEPTRRALELLGDPESSFQVIHITGTNGKSSTSRIAESLIRSSGLRTGLFVSPHLYKVNERIVIDGEPIRDEDLVETWDGIQWVLQQVDDETVAAGDRPLTYFEALTILAVAAFAEAPIDVAIMEVGMGGEWDSTNVLYGDVAAFTPISLDHTDRLGSTIAEIAETKSAIMKEGARALTAAQPADALEVLNRVAQERGVLLNVEDISDGSNVGVLNIAPAIGGQLVTIHGMTKTYEPAFLPLLGAHQAQNAAIAVGAVELLLKDDGEGLSDEVVQEGLMNASSPGRLQLIAANPPVIIDAAHNPGSAVVLSQALKDYFPPNNIVAVMAVLEDKDAKGIFAALSGQIRHVIITESRSERATDAFELGKIAEGFFDTVEVEPDLFSALGTAREVADQIENPLILVTGSITLIGQAASIYRENWNHE